MTNTIIAYLKDMWTLAFNAELQGVWFYAAVYAVLVCGYSLIYQIRIRRWPSASGELLSADLAKFGHTTFSAGEQDYQVNALYAYRVGDKAYEGKRVSPWHIMVTHNLRFILNLQLAQIKPNAEGQVAVFYNPRRPHKSFLLTPGFIGMAFTLLLAIGPMAAYVYRYHA